MKHTVAYEGVAGVTFGVSSLVVTSYPYRAAGRTYGSIVLVLV